MSVQGSALTMISLLLTMAVQAEEPTTSAAPAPQDVRMLGEVPNYAEILVHQWSAGVPADVTEAERSAEHYGLLVDAGPSEPLSLQECIALALQNNTDLKIQRLGPLAATSEVRAARAVFDPLLFADVTRDRAVSPATTFLTAGGSPFLFNQNLTVNAGLRKTLLSGGELSLEWRNNRLVTNPSIANTLVPRYTTSLGLSLIQPLLRDFGWRYALLLVEVAQETEQAAYHEYAAGISTLVGRVETAYWNLVSAIQNVQVQEQSLTLARELLRQNEGKFAVGTLPQTAVLEAKSEVASREATLIGARNLSDIARDELRALINYRKPDAAALLLIEPRDKPTVPPYTIDLQRSLETALENRPELIAARLEFRGKGLQRKVAENQLLPRVNLVAGIGVNSLSGHDANVSFGDPPLSVEVNPALKGSYDRALALLPDGRFYDYSAGATVEIPIGNAQAKADYVKAKIDLEQSRLSLRQLEETVTLEIKTAVSNLESDLKSIDATRIARELGEENLRNQQARYDVGLATTKDLLDFQDKLTQARFREIEALTKYNTDLAEMRRVEGSLLSARNIIIERVAPERPPWWARF